jgi:hypothetical protein
MASAFRAPVLGEIRYVGSYKTVVYAVFKEGQR